MSARTTITGAVLGVLPGATLDARITVEQPLQTGRDTWTGTVASLAERIADAIEAGKGTREGESTPTLSARGARTAVLIAIARGLREQPTGARLLDGLDELGEAAVCEDAEAMTEWADALAALVGVDEGLGAAATAPLTVYRAEHETIRVGHYTTEAAARRHCESLVSDEYPADRTLTYLWAGLGDEDDDPEEPYELVVQVDGGAQVFTGYVVVPLAVAVAYDPDAE
ncbi:hypothetical protein ACFWOS_06085 [Streptomyces rubiginosohelvolus]|uniref:hypothetical protein n=1 Tax=Streptomyces rubiginosohelvolus TaxID=67362 RepID=UPI003647EB1F